MIKTIVKKFGMFIHKNRLEKALKQEACLNIKIQKVTDDDGYLYFLLKSEEDAVNLASELCKNKPVETFLDEEIKIVRMDMLSKQNRAIREMCR